MGELGASALAGVARHDAPDMGGGHGPAPAPAGGGSLEAAILGRQVPLAVINVIVGWLFVLVLGRHVDPTLWVGWLAALILIQLLRLAVGRDGARLAGPRLPIPLPTLLTAFSVASGLAWGSAALLFFGVGGPWEQSLIPFVLAGMAAGAVAALSPSLPALYGFLAASLCPYAARLALVGSRDALAMATLTLCFGLGMAMLGRRTHAMLDRVASLNRENLALVHDLRQASAELEQRVEARTMQLRATVAVLQDEVEQRRRSEAQVRHLLGHDPLTNLPNRLLLLDRLDQAIARARREKGGLAVAAIDVDRFKEINDEHGHLMGDQVLRMLGERLRSILRASDTIARLGGDEFVLVAPGPRGSRPLTLLGERLAAVATRPLEVAGKELATSLSIGIAGFPEHGRDANALLTAADLALYQAKARGRGRYCVLTSAMQSGALDRRRLESELEQAVGREELRLLYQPRLALPEGRLIAAEALLRWNHPRLGLLEPQAFIPIAESSGAIREIGNWVLRTACRDAAGWQGGPQPIRVAVNLSAHEFRQPDLLVRVSAALTAGGLAPGVLELEITESAYLDRTVGAVAADLERLVELGVRIAIDDFGTGYSSLAYLTWLPFHTIKIDQSFVASVDRDARAAAIVRTIVTLAHELDKTVVAEGIETVEQMRAVYAVGCAQAQGFLLSRPIPAASLPGFHCALPARLGTQLPGQPEPGGTPPP